MLEELKGSPSEIFTRSWNASETSVPLGPAAYLDCETVERYGLSERSKAHLMPDATEAMTESVRRFDSLRAQGTPIYGTTTGFGPFVRYVSVLAVTYRTEAGCSLILAQGGGHMLPCQSCALLN
jgi:hypothetical protein